MEPLPLPAGTRAAAFFDLEKTLTSDAVEQVVALTLYRERALPLSSLLRVLWIYGQYNLGLIGNFPDMKRAGAKIFVGRKHADDLAIIRRIYTQSLAQRVFGEARQLVAAFRAAGYEVHIISSTYAFMIAPYAEDIGVDSYTGVELVVEDGICSGALLPTIPHQQAKAEVVDKLANTRGLHLASSYAFGDSPNDIAMLESVGHPVAINPSRGLLKVARSRSWLIEGWGA